MSAKVHLRIIVFDLMAKAVYLHNLFAGVDFVVKVATKGHPFHCQSGVFLR